MDKIIAFLEEGKDIRNCMDQWGTKEIEYTAIFGKSSVRALSVKSMFSSVSRTTQQLSGNWFGTAAITTTMKLLDAVPFQICSVVV